MNRLPSPVRSLGYLGVGCDDPGAWTAFAVDILGAVAIEDGDRVLLCTDEHHHRVVVESGGEGLLYVGWEVDGPQELAELDRRLEAEGVERRSGAASMCEDRRVRELIAFQDPSGIRHEAFWGRASRVGVPFRSPVGVSAFVDGIGHYVLHTDRVDETRDFFTGVLGFAITDFRRGAWFLRCGHRHHSVALVDSDEVRLHHFMLEVGDLDDVGRALDRVRAANVQARELGRHSNDLTVSFYLWTPSGFELEYGWGSVELREPFPPAREIDSGDRWGHQLVKPGAHRGRA